MRGRCEENKRREFCDKIALENFATANRSTIIYYSSIPHCVETLDTQVCYYKNGLFLAKFTIILICYLLTDDSLLLHYQKHSKIVKKFIYEKIKNI